MKINFFYILFYFKYHYIPFADFNTLEHFITQLDPNSLYIIIPIISKDGKDNNPHLILSKQFLLTKYSNPDLIMKFIMNQLELFCLDFEFELEHDKFFYLIFKYKKILII
jgi:hypothetical protein